MLKNTGSHTFKNLQLNTGLLFYNIKVEEFECGGSLRSALESALEDGGNFLGATRRGAVFSARPIVRQYRSDGDFYVKLEGTVISGWEVELSAEIVEFTPEIIRQILPKAKIDDQMLNVTKLNLQEILSAQRENLIWVGDLSGGGLIAIELRNAMNVGGIRLNAESSTENSIAVRFIPHSGEFFNPGKPPFEIYFLSN